MESQPDAQEPISENRQNLEQETSESIFNLLTEEIKDLHEGDKLQGVTPWILSATLISMAWLIVQDVWSSSVTLGPVHYVFLIASLILSIALSVRGMFNLMTPAYLGRKPFRRLDADTTFLDVFVTMLWFGLLAYALLTLPEAERGYVSKSVGILFAFQALTGVAVILAMSFRFPFPTSSKLSFVVFFIIVAEIILCTILMGILLKSNTFAIATASDVRVGGLIALGSYAIVLLARSSSGSSRKRKILTDIRRDLILSPATVEEIRHRTSIALDGFGMSEVVREDIGILLNLISDVRSVYSEAFRKIDALKASIPIFSPEGKKITEIEKIALANTLDVLEIYSQRAADIARIYWQRVSRLQLRLRLAERLTKTGGADKLSVLAELNRAQIPADEALSKFVDEFKTLQTAWNYWFPNDPRGFIPFSLSSKRP